MTDVLSPKMAKAKNNSKNRNECNSGSRVENLGFNNSAIIEERCTTKEYDSAPVLGIIPVWVPARSAQLETANHQCGWITSCLVVTSNRHNQKTVAFRQS